jgi:hypothetical protein
MLAALRLHGLEVSILSASDDGSGLNADLPLGHWHEHLVVQVLAFPRWSPPLVTVREYASVRLFYLPTP